MPTLLEKEIDRALEGLLSPTPSPAKGAQRATGSTAVPPRRTVAPVVRFSPLFAEPPVTSRRKRRSLIVLSVAVHVVLFVTVLLMPRRAQTIVEPSLPIAIVFTAPVPEIHEPMRAPALPKAPPKPKPAPERRNEPEPPVVEAPKPVPKPVIPEVVAPPPIKVEPVRPRPVVRTGLLEEATAGPPVVASKSSRSAVVVAAGFEGTGSVAASPGRPGRVVEATFDTGPATKAKPKQGTPGAVQSSGFSEEVASTPDRQSGE